MDITRKELLAHTAALMDRLKELEDRITALEEAMEDEDAGTTER